MDTCGELCGFNEAKERTNNRCLRRPSGFFSSSIAVIWLNIAVSYALLLLLLTEFVSSTVVDFLHAVIMNWFCLALQGCPGVNPVWPRPKNRWNTDEFQAACLVSQSELRNKHQRSIPNRVYHEHNWGFHNCPSL